MPGEVANETTQVHQPAWRCGSSRAAHGAGAAAGKAAPDSDFPSGNLDYPSDSNGWGERMARVFRMAYAVDLAELLRRMADDVHQILRGAKPGDIPIYQPTKFELLINLKGTGVFLNKPDAAIAQV
jgi:hypothetical protein